MKAHPSLSRVRLRDRRGLVHPVLFGRGTYGRGTASNELGRSTDQAPREEEVIAMRRHLLILGALGSLVLLGWAATQPGAIGAADKPEPAARRDSRTTENKPADTGKTWTTAVDPKELSGNVRKGLGWLAEHQLPGGGWGQGEESAQMGGGAALRNTPNVADTCIAALALLRSGSTPREGPYRDAIVKAVRFVRSQVEESDSQSLTVTSVQGTRVQQKLGPNIDTFLASMLLAEVKGRMPDGAGEKGVVAALDKVLEKIKRHQKADGSFDGAGWAPILAQAMCGKGINRAKQAGAQVSDTVLARAEDGAKLAFNASTKPAATAAPALSGGRVARSYDRAGGGGMMGAAGVELYARAASVGVLQDSVNTGKARERELRDKVKNGKDEKERNEASVLLGRIDDARKVQQDAQAAVVGRLGDKNFVAGFGSNGGEEFLSYMNIAESLVVKGGNDWKKWDAEMTQNLNRIQNDDGSWSGHHCITGRTFCTSTALLVLMADRTPVPVEPREAGKATEK
jgi:hypothetical protein